jgi:hypothetical protein
MFLFRSLMTSAFAFSTIVLAQAAIAGETFQCEEVELIVDDQVQTDLGQLCTVSHRSSHVFSSPALSTLSSAASQTDSAASEHCTNQGLVRARLVDNFLVNNFLVEATGVLNTKFGSDALITGKFLCIPETVGIIMPVKWRRPLN